MTAREIDIVRLTRWDDRWSAESTLTVLDEIEEIANQLHELANPYDSRGKYDGLILEQADELLDRIRTRVAIIASPVESSLRELAEPAAGAA